MQRSQTTGFYDTFAQTQAVACIYAGSSSDSFLLTGLACVCSVGERERGGTLTPGRAFSLRSDRAESSRGVGPPATEKENPPFFIVKDAVECDGLISKGPGRGISERKGPAKATEGKGESRKRFPPYRLQLSGLEWEYADELVPAVSAAASPTVRTSSARVKLWINRCVFRTRRWNCWGKFESLFCVWGRSGVYIWGFTQRLVETRGVRTAEVWTAASFSALLLLLLVVVLKPNWSIQLCRKTSGG